MATSTLTGEAKITKPLSDHEALIENMRLMNEIVMHMKEIPMLPSEKPNDVSPLQRVEFPDAGGVLTYMEGHEYPYKGFPYHEFVDRIDLVKKIVRGTLSGIYHELKKKNKLWFLTLIPSLWVAKSAVRSGIFVVYRIMERFRLKKERYCPAIRELYRAFDVDNVAWNVEERELRVRMRDAVCMLLEFDNAYRYRMQDIVPELNQEAIRANSTSEIGRLLDIMADREKTQEIKDTWTLFRLVVRWYLRFDKQMKNILRDVLSNLDLDKMKLDEGDRHYCLKRKDYTFKFMSN